MRSHKPGQHCIRSKKWKTINSVAKRKQSSSVAAQSWVSLATEFLRLKHFLVYQDTSYDRSTQHFGDANELLYLKDSEDVEVESHGSFETLEEAQKRKKYLEKIILIQRNFRCYRLRCCIKICAAEYRRLMTIKRKREERIKQDYINSYKKSGSFPRTKKDFDMLFAQIATWKEGEVRKDFILTQFNLKILPDPTNHRRLHRPIKNRRDPSTSGEGNSTAERHREASQWDPEGNANGATRSHLKDAQRDGQVDWLQKWDATSASKLKSFSFSFRF